MCSSAPIASPTVFQPVTPNATLPVNTVEASSNEKTCITPKYLIEEYYKSNSPKKLQFEY